MGFATEGQKKELFMRIRKLKNYFSDNKMSQALVERQAQIKPYWVKKALKIKYEAEIGSDNYERLLFVTEVLEKTRELLKYHGEFCLGFRKLDVMEFYDAYKALYAEFKIQNQDDLIKDVSSELEHSFKMLERVRLQSFDEYVIENFSRERAELILETRQYLVMRREITGLRLDRYMWFDQLENGVTVYGETEDGEELEAVLETTEEEAEKYRRTIEKIDERIEMLQAILEQDSPSPDALAQTAAIEEEYYLLHCKEYEEDLSDRKLAAMDGLKRHIFQEANMYRMSADRQRAILAVFLDRCFDERGYLLPEHFGSGIYLMNKGVGRSLQSCDWVTNRQRFKIGDSVASNAADDLLYRFIDDHRRVLLSTLYSDKMRAVKQELKCVSRAVLEKTFMLLRKKFYFESLESENSEEYYKTLSEYCDLIALGFPSSKIGEITPEIVYGVFYDICSKCGWKYEPSGRLVINIHEKLEYTRSDWFWQLYIYSYCTRYDQTKKLIALIRQWELDEREKEDRSEK